PARDRLRDAAGHAAAARPDRGDPALRLSERLARAPHLGLDPPLPVHSGGRRLLLRPLDRRSALTIARRSLAEWGRAWLSLRVDAVGDGGGVMSDASDEIRGDAGDVSTHSLT